MTIWQLNRSTPFCLVIQILNEEERSHHKVGVSQKTGVLRKKKQKHSKIMTISDENKQLLVEEIPDQIQSLVESEIQNSPLEVALATDIHFSGDYGQDWLLVTQTSLFAAQRNGTPDYQIKEVT